MDTLIRSRDAEAKIAAIADALAEGRIDPLEGCRQVVALRTLLSDDSLADDDLQVLVAIESELDDMPSDFQRDQWAASPLAEMDRQKMSYLREVEPELFRACRGLAAKWGDSPRS